MTTEKQIVANRQNARRSTGPRTPEGKATSAQNARKHSLLSQCLLVPGEDPEALKELQDGMIARYNPEGQLELELIERMVACLWRLRRLQAVEAGVFECGQEALKNGQKNALDDYDEEDDYDDEDWDGEASDEDDCVAPPEVKPEVQEDEGGNVRRALGYAFLTYGADDDTFSKLTRYEVAIERSFYRALHELQRLQAARAGEHVAPPVAIDVTVTPALIKADQ